MAKITLNSDSELIQLFELDGVARRLITQHGLTDWHFVWDRSKTRGGQCRYSQKEIGISAYLAVTWTVEKFRDVVLHEIAHALIGPGHGHNKVWKSKARDIGCSAERCWGAVSSGRYVGTCPNGHKIYKQRRSKIMSQQRSCPRCCPGHFDSRYLITWEER